MGWDPTERLTLSLFTTHCSFKLFLTLPGPFLKGAFLSLIHRKQKDRPSPRDCAMSLLPGSSGPRNTRERHPGSNTQSGTVVEDAGHLFPTPGALQRLGEEKVVPATAVFPSLFSFHYHSSKKTSFDFS